MACVLPVRIGEARKRGYAGSSAARNFALTPPGYHIAGAIGTIISGETATQFAIQDTADDVTLAKRH
jgi:hypothetical protein